MKNDTYLIKEETLTDIADAIREKKQSEDTIAVSDFADEIENLPSGGGEKVSPKTIKFDGDTSEVIYLDNLDVSKMTSLNQLFYNCKQLYKLDLSKLDTTTITQMSEMFANTANQAQHPLEFNFTMNTSNVTSMWRMFMNFGRYATSTQELDLSAWNTSKVTDMSYAFSQAEKITSLNLSSWTIGATSLAYMFNQCIRLTHIDIRNFVFDNVSSYTNMFGQSASMGVPNTCEIIVKDDTAKTWVTSNFSRLTNVKTVAEYEAE